MEGGEGLSAEETMDAAMMEWVTFFLTLPPVAPADGEGRSERFLFTPALARHRGALA